MESKYDTIKITPEDYRPAAALIPAGTTTLQIDRRMKAAGLSFPLIAKPDLGFRGLLVKKVKHMQELEAYLQQYPIDFILQEYIDWPEEAGVLYYRLPGAAHGKISSITTKSFLRVTGNGRDSVRQLIEQSPRALLQLEQLENDFPLLMDKRPSAGEQVPLGIVGNHAKGTQFFNGNHLINEQIQRTFDRISRQVEGFYYGRFDLKCLHLDALKNGEGLRIIEINGVCSEPTHIYDPQRGSYWSALGAIIQHWAVIYRIARTNRKQGVSYLSHRTTAREFLRLFAYQRQLKKWSGKN